MLLFAEHAKKGLTRAEIKKAAMPDVKDSRGKVFDYAFSHANEMLKDTFGFKIAPAIGKSVVHQPDAQATQDAEAGTQAGDGEEHGEKGGPQKYFLVSSLVRRPPVAFDPSEKAEAAYRALVLVVIGVIRFASNKLSEEKLWECLKVSRLTRVDSPASSGRALIPRSREDALRGCSPASSSLESRSVNPSTSPTARAHSALSAGHRPG